MKILIVSATVFEIAPLLDHLDKTWSKPSFFEYKKGDTSVYPLITGVGALATSFGMSRLANIKEIDIAINVGIAGGSTVEIGEVVEVVHDQFGDIGVENADGRFEDLFDLELTDENTAPFTNKILSNLKPKLTLNLPKVIGITVNTIPGTQQHIDALNNKYTFDIETMESAGFFYACKSMDMKFHAIRSISNKIEPRNKDRWQIPLAIDKLNEKVIAVVEGLQ
jgi:futalosine hydrolase